MWRLILSAWSMIDCKLEPFPEIKITAFIFYLIMTCSPVEAITSPISQAFSPQSVKCLIVAVDDSFGIMTIIPTPQLSTLYISVVSMLPWVWIHLKISGWTHEFESNLAARLLGKTLGMFSRSPPPVIWDIAWTGRVLVKDNMDWT